MSPAGRRSRRSIETPRGRARVSLWWPRGPTRGSLVCGHGAGGLSWSADMLALTSLAQEGIVVGLVEQPWRVAGRRVAAPPPHLDEAWLAVLRRLRHGRAALPEPIVVGGRSAGARVACRTAKDTEAFGVLALAFPLRPHRRDGSAGPTRGPELDIEVPLMVVQGRRDAFGSARDVAAELGVGVQVTPTMDRQQVVEVAGAHGFSRDVADVLRASRLWLNNVLPDAHG